MTDTKPRSPLKLIRRKFGRSGKLLLILVSTAILRSESSGNHDHTVTCSMYVTIDGVWIGEWIYWPLIQTNQNYKHNAIANLHTLQIARAHAKSCQSAFTSRFLVKNLNNGDC
jgi:hypothetical protein